MSLLKQPYEIKTDNLKLKILIYGQPGLGKTTLALSMPNPVLIDADNGVHRVAPAHRVPTLQVSSYQEVLDLLASGELAPFGSIVIDTAGQLLDYMGAWLAGKDPKLAKRDGALTMQGYGARKAQFLSLLKAISVMGKHLVFVAHEREEKDGDNKLIRPEIGGSSGGDLIKTLDLVGYMEAIGKERTISFAPCEKYYAKNSARIDDVQKVPSLKGNEPNAFMSSVVEKCREEMEAESEDAKKYSALMEEVAGIIGSIRDAGTANAAGREIQGIPAMWDSQIKARAMLGEKAKSLGLRYDKAKKGFAADSDGPSQADREEVA
jgi:hypothetical protein